MIGLDLADPRPFAVSLATGMLLLGFGLCLLRLWRGPSTADRVAALDLTTYLTVAFAGVRAVAEQEVHLLRPAVVAALLAFLGTLAFARYLERRALVREERQWRR
jgi:multicomponent Na+:H+ antiporter subunit F